MKIPSAREVLCLAVIIGAAACDLSTPTEPQNPLDLQLDFCAADVPVWFVYQNEDMSSATRLFPDAEGTFRFTATNRVTIGMVFQNGADYHTELFYATNEELAGLSAVGCLEALGSKTVNGTVAGVGPNQTAVVTMGFASVELAPGNTSYSLTGLPERALDLIATRQTTTATSSIADRLVIRRTQNITNNGNVPLLDFANGSDVIQPATAAASISGILSGEFAFLQNSFFSQLETSHSLSYAEALGNGARAFAAVPQTSLAVGDYHDLILQSIDGTIGSVRGVENFFRGPTDQTLALGPVLNDPSISDVTAPTGPVILRLELPAQLSYDDAVAVRYEQQLNLSVITVALFVTSGYAQGTPSVWALQIPNLRGVPGWIEAWELRTGAPIDWSVTGFSGRPELLLGARPEDGEFVRYAIRRSDPAAAAAVSTARNGSLRSVYTNRLRLPTP